jgi:uncharacterized protein (DUF302 family)
MEGLIRVSSRFGPRETMNRLEAEVRAVGLDVFARIDHTAGAAKVGLELTPIELIIFGNARAGTPLMQVDPTIGIDLPLKALVWQEAAGATWIAYHEPAWLAQRHGLGGKMDRIIDRMKVTLDAVSRKAAGEQ